MSTLSKLFSTLLLLTSLSAASVLAQDTDSPGTGETAGLDLFDEDAEFTDTGWAQFYVSLGGIYLDADGSFSVHTAPGDTVTIIDFDRVGLDERDSSHWLTMNWRSARSRWGAWFGSWRYDVTGTREWKKSLEIPGKEFIPAGANVTSLFDAKWYILEATYSFYRSSSVDTGIGFGLHMVDLDTRVRGRNLADSAAEEEIVSENLDALAPLPNLLVYVYWKFAPDWSIVSRLGYFGLNYDKYSGQMINSHTMLNYEISERWVLGLGYQFVELDLKVEERFHLQVYDMDFCGPMAFLRFNF